MSALAYKLDYAMRSCQARGFLVEYHADEPGAVRPSEVSNTDELIVVVEGEAEVELSGKTVHATEGQEVLIPASVSHKVRNAGPCMLHWVCGSGRKPSQPD